MSNQTSILQHIPKLEGSSNYKTWSILCKSSLQASSSWKFVVDTTTPPIKHVDERDYMFKERCDVYLSRVAQARHTILITCRPHIQLTLNNIETAKDCWDKLSASYELEGLIYVQDVWLQFDRCNFNGGDNIEEFCSTYQAILDRCLSMDIVIQDKIKAIKFVSILDSHFEIWSSQKWDQMRCTGEYPTLDSLINEICDESKHKQSRVSLHAVAVTSTKASNSTQHVEVVYLHCGLP